MTQMSSTRTEPHNGPDGPEPCESFGLHPLPVSVRTVREESASSDRGSCLPEQGRFGETLDRNTLEVLVALARTVDASSPWTANHSKRVAGLATAIGREVGLSLEQLGTLCCAALLHDIGKVGVSTNILDKPGQLTRTELEHMEEHPQKGARILEPLTMYAPVVPIVLQHHERLNGTGYPNRLLGESICSGARILAVADVYDALVSVRPYRTPWDRQRAMAFIQAGAESLFDNRIVEAFLDIMTSADPEDGGADVDVSEVLLDVTPGNGTFCLLRRQSDA